MNRNTLQSALNTLKIGMQVALNANYRSSISFSADEFAEIVPVIEATLAPPLPVESDAWKRLEDTLRRCAQTANSAYVDFYIETAACGPMANALREFRARPTFKYRGMPDDTGTKCHECDGDDYYLADHSLECVYCGTLHPREKIRSGVSVRIQQRGQRVWVQRVPKSKQHVFDRVMDDIRKASERGIKLTTINLTVDEVKEMARAVWDTTPAGMIAAGRRYEEHEARMFVEIGKGTCTLYSLPVVLA